MAGPGQDYLPPEQKPGSKKTEMFHLMPSGRIQRQLIKKRDMPKDIRGDKGEPTDNRVEQGVPKTFKRIPNEKRAQNLTSKRARQTGENWQVGCSGQYQRRSQHHQ